MLSKKQYPLGKTITLEALEQDVHQVNHWLRLTEPVSFLPAINAWLVTRHDDASKVMRDAKTYTVEHPGFTTGQVIGPTMLSLDGMVHQKHRRPFDPPFRKRAVNGRFAEKIAAHVDSLLDRLEVSGQAELKSEFAGPVSVLTMKTALGMEAMLTEHALQLNNDIINSVTRLTAGQPLDEAGKAAFAMFRESMTPELNADAASSVLAAANMAAGELNEEELLSNAALLLIGGIETTEGMLANALYHLLTNPDVLAMVRADLLLVPKIVEESLRMEPAAGVVDRFATTDVTLRGAEIKAGDLVRVSLNGANRDTAVFPNPDQFDISRPNLQSHVTFAHGPHVCLGLHLARLEVAHALQKLVERLPNVQLDPALAEDAKPVGLVFRKPKALHVVW